MMADNEPVAARIVALETRVDGLRKDLGEFRESQSKAMEIRWTRIVTVSGVLASIIIAMCIGIWNLLFVPLKDANKDFAATLGAIAAELKMKVDRYELSDIRSDIRANAKELSELAPDVKELNNIRSELRTSIHELNNRIDDLNSAHRRRP